MHDGGGGVVCVVVRVLVGCAAAVEVEVRVEVAARGAVEAVDAVDDGAPAALVLATAELPGAGAPALDVELALEPPPGP